MTLPRFVDDRRGMTGAEKALLITFALGIIALIGALLGGGTRSAGSDAQRTLSMGLGAQGGAGVAKMGWEGSPTAAMPRPPPPSGSGSWGVTSGGWGVGERSAAEPGAAAPEQAFGVQIKAEDVDPGAAREVKKFIGQLVGKNRFAQEQLARERVAIVIIPHDKKMTDLPHFAALRGKRTFDGRLWDDVRGSGGMRAPDGTFAIAVPEENLVDIPGARDAYGKGYSVGMHEFAHTLHEKGMSAEQKARITALYEARKRAGGPWTEAYGASNELEYFAQATNAYFGKNQGVGQNGARWLKENDPEMHAFLEKLYGPP